MLLKPAVGIALAAFVAGCLDDDWTYRPYVSDAQLSGDVVADGAHEDVSQARTLTGAIGAAGVWQSTRYRIVGGFDHPARVCNANRTRCVTGGISP